jgi:hypothetical protein
MAIVVATVLHADNYRKLDHKKYTDTDEYEVWQCDVYLNITGGEDYATANDCTVSPATVIQSKRDGKTVTVLAATALKGGSYNLAATPTVDSLYGLGLVSGVSANVITLPLTAEDWSTEMTNATVLSTATDKEPSALTVTFKQTLLGE